MDSYTTGILNIDKNIVLTLAKGNYLDTMRLSPAAKADLAWWLDNVLQSKSPISHDSIDTEITCDASKAEEQLPIELLPKAFGLLENSHNTLQLNLDYLDLLGPE